MAKKTTNPAEISTTTGEAPETTTTATSGTDVVVSVFNKHGSEIVGHGCLTGEDAVAYVNEFGGFYSVTTSPKVPELDINDFELKVDGEVITPPDSVKTMPELVSFALANKCTWRRKSKDILKIDTPEENVFRVTVLKDTSLVMPQLWLDVWVEGDKHEQQNFSSWLIKSRCSRATSPQTADLVIFTGGTDVDPTLYGEKRMSSTDTPDVARDLREMFLYRECVENGIPMLGICRGAQFLAVMNGAKLYQHVDNHNAPHDIFDLKNMKIVTNASSVHHQMVIEDKHGGMEVIADSNKARNRWISDGINRPGCHTDVEAFFYRDTVSLGIQGHPEYQSYPVFSKWSCDIIEQYIMDNPDIALRTTEGSGEYKYRRVKEELLEERKHRLVCKAQIKETV